MHEAGKENIILTELPGLKLPGKFMKRAPVLMFFLSAMQPGQGGSYEVFYPGGCGSCFLYPNRPRSLKSAGQYPGKQESMQCAEQKFDMKKGPGHGRGRCKSGAVFLRWVIRAVLCVGDDIRVG